MATTADTHRGFGELLSKLRNDTTRLMKEEVELAKRETQSQLQTVQKRAAAAAVAGAVAHMGGLLILLGIALLLDIVMPLWVAVLLVGVIASVAAGALAMRQKQQLQALDPAPKRAAARAQRDYEAMKEAAR